MRSSTHKFENFRSRPKSDGPNIFLYPLVIVFFSFAAFSNFTFIFIFAGRDVLCGWLSARGAAYELNKTIRYSCEKKKTFLIKWNLETLCPCDKNKIKLYTPRKNSHFIHEIIFLLVQVQVYYSIVEDERFATTFTDITSKFWWGYGSDEKIRNSRIGKWGWLSKSLSL